MLGREANLVIRCNGTVTGEIEHVPQGSWTGGLARCAVQTARASRALHRVHTFNEAKKCWTGCLACGGSACWAGWEIIFVDDDRPDGAASAARDLTRTDCAASSHCDSPNCSSSFARAATASPNSNSLIVFKYLGLLLTELFGNGLFLRLFSSLWRQRPRRPPMRRTARLVFA